MTYYRMMVEYSRDAEEAAKAAIEQHKVVEENGIPVGRDITAEQFAEVACRASAVHRCSGTVYDKTNGKWTEFTVVATHTRGGYNGLGNGEQPAAVARLVRRGEPTKFLAVGCEHEWTGGRAGLCYYRYTCKHCGCTWEVDSSD